MMEQDREALCGPRSRRDPDRRAGRAGTTTSEVTLGGRRIRIPRPRVRIRPARLLALPSYVFAAQRDPLDNHTLNAVACGISTRRYARSLEPLTEDLDEQVDLQERRLASLRGAVHPADDGVARRRSAIGISRSC